MKTAHEIINEFITNNAVDQTDFNEWFNDAGYPQDEANAHDSRYLQHLQNYVAERNDSSHG